MAEPVIAVVGAGPAGLRAAEQLAAAGLRPVLFDEADRSGGQIYRQPPAGAERPASDLYGFEAGKAQALHDVGRSLADAIDYRPQTLIWNIFDKRLDTFGPQGYGTLEFDHLILATGAMDRVLPFPGWSMPGVFTLGGAQIALKAQGIGIGRRVAFIGAGPLLPLVAHQYALAGAQIAAVLDVTPFQAKLRNIAGLAMQPATLAKGLWYSLRNTLRGFPVRAGVRSVSAEGTERISGVSWIEASGASRRVDCDAIAASFGLRSETQLADLAGCRFAFDSTLRQWLPERSPEGRSSLPYVYLAGDGSGIGGADVAELQGMRAALSLLADLGRSPDPARTARIDALLQRQRRFRHALEQAYPYPHHLVDAIRDDEIICRCEGITAGTLRQAATQRDAIEINRLKAFTRVGMGRCQGRVCGHAAAEVLAQCLGRPVETVGRLRGQPPVKPIPVGGLP
jgi:NADPH-dependent 2,4-dienoyl-CoA reductase/sulfur reductase-like enzyme